ncbi:hypothetical protein Gpo141_00006363 [Globisporangium polare]
MRYATKATSDLLAPGSLFYENLARESIAASSRTAVSISYNLFAVSDLSFLDLASLVPLVNRSGGQLAHYSLSEASAMPPDLHACLTRPCIFDVSMHVLTSKDMRVTGTPGELQKRRLNWWRRRSSPGWRWRRPLCDAQTNVLMEFEFTSRDGFPATMERIPTVQVCMVYTEFSRQSVSDDGSNNEDGDNVHLTPRRKARICTYQIGAAFSGRDCQDKANLGVVLSSVAAKAHAIRTSARKTSAARQFLTEWLANFMTKYHLSMQPGKSGDLVVDMELESHARLRWLSRYVFGLLNSRGLARFLSVHPDIQTSLSAQFNRIGSEHIYTALYPQLMAFKDLNEAIAARIPLSHLAMIKSSGRVFLLDAYFAVIIMYTSENEAATDKLPFPPPHETHIRQEFERRLRDRQLVPRCAIICASSSQHDSHKSLDLRYFNALLLDECGHAGEDYTSFAQNLRTTVRQRLVAANSSSGSDIGIASSYRRLSLLQD